MPENEEMLLIEESGFFNAEEVELEDGTKAYDRVYVSEQFCDYFSLFVGNGVFVNPTNQLMVTEATGSIGLKVRINPGWAFINGMYYHLLEEGELELEQNTGTTVRVDGIFCRYSRSDRAIRIIVGKGRVVPKRLEYDYELLLATVNVVSGALSINVANIRDRRPDEDVCGFVKGLVDVIQTKDLFDRFTATFEEWFDDVKETLGSDKVVNTEILASSWVGNEAPYEAWVSIEDVRENSVVDVCIANDATIDQIDVWLGASIVGGGQNAGEILLKAFGVKPIEDIPITVVVRR